MAFKKWTVLLLALILCFAPAACSGSGSAATATAAPSPTAVETPEPTATPEPGDWSYIKGRGKLVIGYTIYEPMNYLDNNGNLIGFDTEFAEAACEKLGVEPDFVEISWTGKEEILNSKSIDCIWSGLAVTDDGGESMDFTQSYLSSRQAVVIRKSDAGKYTALESLSSANLVAEASSAGESAITSEEALASANYTAADRQTDALLAVEAGTADAAVLDYMLARSLVGEGTDYGDLMVADGLYLTGEENAVGFRKGSTAVAEVNKVIDELIADGTLNRIAEAYGLENQLIANQK
jgi:polar amino acid transport system substrate-binding protein